MWAKIAAGIVSRDRWPDLGLHRCTALFQHWAVLAITLLRFAVFGSSMRLISVSPSLRYGNGDPPTRAAAGWVVRICWKLSGRIDFCCRCALQADMRTNVTGTEGRSCRGGRKPHLNGIDGRISENIWQRKRQMRAARREFCCPEQRWLQLVRKAGPRPAASPMWTARWS